jgi:hypothetical protein
MTKEELQPQADEVFKSLPHALKLIATSNGQFFEDTENNRGNVASYAKDNALEIFHFDRPEPETKEVAEEPKVEEPVVEEPVVEEPAAEEPVVEEPKAEEPKPAAKKAAKKA